MLNPGYFDRNKCLHQITLCSDDVIIQGITKPDIWASFQADIDNVN